MLIWMLGEGLGAIANEEWGEGGEGAAEKAKVAAGAAAHQLLLFPPPPPLRGKGANPVSCERGNQRSPI